MPLPHPPPGLGHRGSHPRRYPAVYPSAAGAGTADGGLLRLLGNSGLQAGPPMGIPVGRPLPPICHSGLHTGHGVYRKIHSHGTQRYWPPGINHKEIGNN